ncbi:MAG TPA: penicillin-binding protein 2 [Acidimicrobiales bacterium]|nr:penicillin-binding protein 2 [Acidimicrobiales bacterium]
MRLAIFLIFLALALRLVAVQGFSNAKYASIGTAEVTTSEDLPALRGGIYDRDGAVLAMSEPRVDVIADPFLIHDPQTEASELAPLLGSSESSLQVLLSDRSGYEVLAREVDDPTAKKVAALDLVGITQQPDSERIYPSGQLAAALIGSVHSNGSGASGLELLYDDLLSGRNGVATAQVSPSGIVLPGSNHTTGPRQGTGIELTIDQPLEYVAEQALGAEINASHAKSGIAIVMNTHTGDILAMANLEPGAGDTIVQAPQNLALTRVYEPGSVFKLVTFSAALQEGLITPQEPFSVPSSIMIDGSVFHDAESHPTETLTATDILAQSSNIGTIEIAERLGKESLAQQISRLGFGTPTDLDFPGESAGIVLDPNEWEPTDMASTPIGQDDAVTAQQVLDMVNSIATGGVMIQPRLVRALVDPDGSVTSVPEPAEHRVISAFVSSELTTMMESVVQDGTAVAAGIPGYSVAGKTGTAQIPNSDHSGYISGAYMATFAGFAPADDPELSAIVVLERPSPIFGGLVAAPVFSQIMRYALHRYGIPTSPGNISGGTATAIPFPAPTKVSPAQQASAAH